MVKDLTLRARRCENDRMGIEDKNKKWGISMKNEEFSRGFFGKGFADEERI